MRVRHVLCLAIVLLVTGGASAQTPLFQGANARIGDLTPVEAMRFDAVQADGSARAAVVVTANPEALVAGGEIEIEIGPSRVTLRPDVLKTLSDGTTVWTASRDGADLVDAVFTVRNGVLAGDLWIDGTRYAVRPLSDSRYVITTGVEEFEIDARVDLAEFSGGGVVDASSVSGGAANTREGSTTITLMVVYTSALADALYDPVLIAQQVVAYTNAAYAQSGIALQIQLVHTYEDPTIPVYTQIRDYLDAISNARIFSGSTATASDGIADAAVGLRNTFGADFVSLFHTFDASSTAGLAAVCASERSAFSAVEAQGTFASGVFAHELGHNLGSGHQNGAGDGCSGASYAHAWSEDQANNPTGTQWRTTMWASVSPTVVQRFSNDALTFTNDGDAAAPLGEATQADNGRLFNERAATVAAFRGDVAQAIPTLTLSDADGTVEQGSIATATLSIQNTGAGPLSFDAPLHRPAPAAPVVSSQAFSTIRGTGTILAMDEGTCATAPSGELALANKYDTVALPFAFPFDGQSYTSVRVSGQGFVTFGTDDGCPPSPPSIPSAAAPDGLISAFWSDDVGAYNFGTPSAVVVEDLGNGRFAIEWSRYGIPVPASSSFDLESAQIILSSTGTIEIVYDGSLGFYITNDRISAMTVGVESTDGTTGTQIPLSDFQSNNSASFVSSILTLATQSGAVTGGSTTDVSVFVDAANLTPGSYTFPLVVYLNTPNDQTVTIPVGITVVAPSRTLADGAGWRLLAPPLAGMTVETLATQNLVQGVPASGPTPGYYAAFTPNLITGYDGIAYVSASSRTEALEPGRGFFWYLYDNDVTPNPNEGSVSVALPAPLGASGRAVSTDVSLSLHTAGDKWNMLGNPYTAALDVSGVAGWVTSGSVTSSVVQSYRNGGYVLSTNTGNQVEPWEGFFLENSTAPALVVPVGARVSAGTFVRRADTRRLALRLDGVDGATGTAIRDEAVTLYFTEGGADGWDLWDATKLENPAWPSLIAGFEGIGTASDPTAAVWKAQESRPYDPGAFSVPIRLGARGFAGRAELSWPTLDLVPESWTVTLVDHETGEAIDLREADRYVFDVASDGSTRTRGVMPGARARLSAGTARFTLFVTSGQAVASEEVPESTRFTALYPNPVASNATIAFSLSQAQSVRVRVVDALGRVIHQHELGSRLPGAHTATWDASSVAPGLYLVEVSTPGWRMTRPVVVQR